MYDWILETSGTLPEASIRGILACAAYGARNQTAIAATLRLIRKNDTTQVPMFFPHGGRFVCQLTVTALHEPEKVYRLTLKTSHQKDVEHLAALLAVIGGDQFGIRINGGPSEEAAVTFCRLRQSHEGLYR